MTEVKLRKACNTCVGRIVPIALGCWRKTVAGGLYIGCYIEMLLYSCVTFLRVEMGVGGLMERVEEDVHKRQAEVVIAVAV